MGKNSFAILGLVIIAMAFALVSCKPEKQVQLPQPILPSSNDFASSAIDDSLAEPDEIETKDKAKLTDNSDLKDYKYTWTDSEDIPPVIVIVDDFGYASGSLLQAFADLPPQIVFAILPDLPQSSNTARLAAKTGHDAIIHVPMEATIAKISPGERYLKPGMDAQAVTDMLDDFIRQMPNAIAANNHMGSTATTDRELMTTVLNHLDSKGMYFVDSVTIGDTVGYKLANTLGYKSIRRNLFLDVPDVSNATIQKRINDLKNYQGRKEPIVIITHCHNESKLKALKKFLAQIDEMGVQLTSLSQYYGSLAVASN